MGNEVDALEEIVRLDTPEVEKLRRRYYRYVHKARGGQREPRWRGVRVIKFPSDLLIYAQVMFKRQPDVLIETGTAYGGSAMFFGDMMELIGNGGHVYTIDISPRTDKPLPQHPRVTYIKGSSVDDEIVERVKESIQDKSVMIVLDSDHSASHVAREMDIYGAMTSVGQYMVVEDCWTHRPGPYSPYSAVVRYLKEHPEYKQVDLEKQFIFAMTRGGWLRRIR
jgi:cephalosporin hydroxylase